MQQGFRAQRDKTPFDKLAQAFARTRLGGWLFVNVFPVIDRRLIPLTGGRLAVAVGQPMLLLHTRGARSGQPRSTPLLYTRHGRGYVVVASKGRRGPSPGLVLQHARASGCGHDRGRRPAHPGPPARRPKAPSVKNCGGWSMTTTTATRCTSSGRASGLSRSCCSSQRDGSRPAGARCTSASRTPRIPAARSGDYLASPGHPSSRQKRTAVELGGIKPMATPVRGSAS